MEECDDGFVLVSDDRDFVSSPAAVAAVAVQQQPATPRQHTDPQSITPPEAAECPLPPAESAAAAAEAAGWQLLRSAKRALSPKHLAHTTLRIRTGSATGSDSPALPSSSPHSAASSPASGAQSRMLTSAPASPNSQQGQGWEEVSAEAGRSTATAQSPVAKLAYAAIVGGLSMWQLVCG